jgi:glycosyltransferase involved in cell wall biosynthesis
MSQSSYPIKGMHYFLKALQILKKKNNLIKVKIAGVNPLNKDDLLSLLKTSNYGYYIHSLIKKFKLTQNIEFLGFLSEKQMIEEYLKANIYISASVIENSSNSISEAMMLGTPIIASNVGGTESLINARENEGVLYQFNDYFMLASQINKLLSNPDLCIELSLNSIKKANILFNKERNINVLKQMYKRIYRR